MGFIDDLKEVNGLSKNHLDILIDIFKSNPLNSNALLSQYRQLCIENGIEKEKADKFYKILSFVCDYCIDEKSIEQGIKEIETNIIKPYLNEIEQIWNYIQNKLVELNEFILRRKEYQLTRISNNLDEFGIICDIRPVYDIKREKIIGYLYPIILSIKSESSESILTFEINESELIKIQKEIDTAVSKLEILKEKFKNV